MKTLLSLNTKLHYDIVSFKMYLLVPATHVRMVARVTTKTVEDTTVTVHCATVVPTANTVRIFLTVTH